MNLEQLGWNPEFSAHFQPYVEQGLVPGRVACEINQFFKVLIPDGELTAEISGRLKYFAASRAELPAVGDWVALEVSPQEAKGVIHAILPRHTEFSRKAVGDRTEEQVIVTNVDTVFIISGLDDDFNLRRLERYLSLTRDSRALPVIVLNKSDLCPDRNEKIREVEAISNGAPVLATSALLNDGVERLRTYLQEGQTVAFLGSSGAGKSTLINAILGEQRQKTKDVHQLTSQGRHTTIHREMILCPSGGIIIDTPGLRELQVWMDENSLRDFFSDIEEWASQCKFRDCTHTTEPGCAVIAAVEQGHLDAGRLENFIKMNKEIRRLELLKDEGARRVEKRQWKKISQWIKKHPKFQR